MLLSLHVWMLLVRLRADGDDGKTSAQLMYEEFTEDVEARLRATGVKVGGHVTLLASSHRHEPQLSAQARDFAGEDWQVPRRAGEDVLRQLLGI